MFKKKQDDPLKARLKKDIDVHAARAQEEYNRKQAQSKRLLNKEYVQAQLAIQQDEDDKINARQQRMIDKTMKQIKKTTLTAFQCHFCKAMVDMSNLTCPNCGQLYCQWCGAPMDMENPGLCPRCQRPPMYTPAELVITKVEDMAPEDRFWETLPTCPKCGATVQPDWPDCPICGAKLSPTAAASTDESADFGEEGEVDAAQGPGDDKKGKKKEEKKGKKTGI